ncbi:NUDIX hydrolase [Flavilitoribacter nigricans]|uniref:NUDIX hydrolase n=1 Tax=Flavilitoribacter nigricans (strain ATCC 23147 / DSM 23189 / NBRC 102662 / NCIMB 1420 / SS-2) TaxID=1122177 RepID=A0A2D0N6Z0_FLAN2|nr:NUDIX hydrolase [Flavilitoribacter nigricans]PHN04302.1 NUDIX hydrolase [Flavilitoribacter nigricans DSM 23189 = NBRC 102662]
MQNFDVEKLHPGLSIDCVIFGFHENELKILILKLKNLNKWALPGGFVEVDKDVDAEAAEVLKRRAGLENIFLRQFYLFGDVARNENDHARKMVDQEVIAPELRDWFEQRFVTVGYYALVEYSKVKAPTPDYTSESCEWRSISELPSLILDHRDILARAHATLKKELNNQPIGMNLLPDHFTMSELQALYETVLEKKLDRRNFRRRMLSYDILIPTNKRRTGVAHKAPMLYEFDRKKYQEAMVSGFRSTW